VIEIRKKTSLSAGQAVGEINLSADNSGCPTLE